MAIAFGDLVEFRTGFRSRWQHGYVETIGAHSYGIRSLAGRLHTITLGGPGRSGRVRELEGASELPAVPPCAAPVDLRLIQGGPAELRAVPRPRARHRSAGYLSYVRSQACCSCGAPGPSDPHHAGARGVGQKADDYSCVPLCRLTRDETALRLLQVQVALLTEWAAGADALVAEHITVPILSRSAS